MKGRRAARGSPRKSKPTGASDGALLEPGTTAVRPVSGAAPDHRGAAMHGLSPLRRLQLKPLRWCHLYGAATAAPTSVVGSPSRGVGSHLGRQEGLRPAGRGPASSGCPNSASPRLDRPRRTADRTFAGLSRYAVIDEGPHRTHAGGRGRTCSGRAVGGERHKSHPCPLWPVGHHRYLAAGGDVSPGGGMPPAASAPTRSRPVCPHPTRALARLDVHLALSGTAGTVTTRA